MGKKRTKQSINAELAEKAGFKRLEDTKKYIVFRMNETYKLYLGKAGALRVGRTVKASYPYPKDALVRAAGGV